MDFLAATDAPVVATVDGQTVQFPVFSLRKLMALCALLSAARVEAAKGSLADTNAEASDRLEALARARMLKADPGDALAFAQSVEGAAWILSAALDGDTSSFERAFHPVVERLPLLELVPLAMQVLRVNNGQRSDPTDPAVTS